MTKTHVKCRALQAAFPCTLPILTGFAFLGMAYGILMRVKGFPFWYPLLTSTVVFGGSLEFVLASLLVSPFSPLHTLATALAVQARHIFYGISMLDVYKDMGWKKYYLIFAMCDESFSLNYTARIPPDVDRGWFMFFVSLLNQSYWVAATTMGGLVGSLIRFETKGLDFVMTAMFTVIFVDQWRKEKRHAASLIGLGATLGCLVLFGKDSFLLPAMGCILALLYAFRGPIEKAGDAA